MCLRVETLVSWVWLNLTTNFWRTRIFDKRSGPGSSIGMITWRLQGSRLRSGPWSWEREFLTEKNQGCFVWVDQAPFLYDAVHQRSAVTEERQRKSGKSKDKSRKSQICSLQLQGHCQERTSKCTSHYAWLLLKN